MRGKGALLSEALGRAVASALHAPGHAWPWQAGPLAPCRPLSRDGQS